MAVAASQWKHPWMESAACPHPQPPFASSPPEMKALCPGHAAPSQSPPSSTGQQPAQQCTGVPCSPAGLSADSWSCPENKPEAQHSWPAGSGCSPDTKLLRSRPASLCLLHDPSGTPQLSTGATHRWDHRKSISWFLPSVLCFVWQTRPKKQMQLWTTYHPINLY